MEISSTFSGNGDFTFGSLFLALIVTLVCCFFSLFPFGLLKFSQSENTKACDRVCSNCKGIGGGSDSMAITATATARMMNGGGDVVMAERERQHMIGASMMEQLVPEITTHALSYLDYPSLCRLSMTNSSMRRAANDDNAWKALYHKIFAVCIWRLATGEPLRLVLRRFGLGISTCHKLVLMVCSAIKNVLMPKYLQWPDDDSTRMIKNAFESVFGIPNVVGSMYTTHIPIIAPKISVAAYCNKRHTERNQKTSYSRLLI